VVEYWLLSFGVCFGDFEMTLDDEILGIFMEICDEVLMVFTMYFLLRGFLCKPYYSMFMFHVSSVFIMFLC
jgi:hypothetical protein